MLNNGGKVITYVVIRMDSCVIYNKLKERDVRKPEIPMMIERETLIPFLRAIISHKDNQMIKEKYLNQVRLQNVCKGTLYGGNGEK